MSLSGVTASSFTPTLRSAFVQTVATHLGIAASRVTITSFARRRGRALLADATTSLTVAFKVAMPAGSAGTEATALSSSVSDMITSPVFHSSLRDAGIPHTGVAVAAAPSVSFSLSSGSSPSASNSSTPGAPPPALSPQQAAAALSTVDLVLSSLIPSTGGNGSSAGGGAARPAPVASPQLINSVASAASIINAVGASPLLPPASTSIGGAGTGQSAAAAAVQKQLEQQREGLLSLVALSLNATAAAKGQPPALSTEEVSGMVSVVAQLTSEPKQLTPAARTAAVSALAALVPSASVMPAETATLVVGSLDSLAAAASGATLTTEQPSPEEMQQLFGAMVDVLDQLIEGQGAQITEANAPPLTFSTDFIQIALRLDDPSLPSPDGSPPRIFTQAFSAPNSPSSFDPLPADTFSGVAAGPMLSQFVSLKFDPYSILQEGGGTPRAALEAVGAAAAAPPQSDDTGASGRVGVTRLAFTRPDSAGGGDVVVTGLRTPLTFMLPLPMESLSGPDAASSGSGGERKPVCQFWDLERSAFSSSGCATLPNPVHPDLTVDWRENLTIASPADLARAWVLNATTDSGKELLAGCNETVLDCSNATDAKRLVFQDPRRPLSFPAVQCGAASKRVLRVIHGANCTLWQPDNKAKCWWNNTAQASKNRSCAHQSHPWSRWPLSIFDDRFSSALASYRHSQGAAALQITRRSAPARISRVRLTGGCHALL